MENQQTRRITEAAQRFTEALTESYRMATGRAVSTQQLSTELMQNFFTGVINNLQTQTEDNREMIQELANQQQRQQEATRSLARESTNAYIEFLESMFFFYRRSSEETERGAEKAQSSVGEVEGGTGEYFSNIISETNRRSAGEA